MALIEFTPNLSRQTRVEARQVAGRSVREVFARFFEEFPEARGYVLDDQGAVRRHVAVFVDGVAILDRAGLSDPVGEEGVVFVMQALSGG
jgi:hypothetical protein